MNLVALFVVASVALVLNVGAGRLRARSPKFSFRWVLYIHLPILAIVPLRQWFELNPWTIPLLVGISVVGQIVGGRMTLNS